VIPANWRTGLERIALAVISAGLFFLLAYTLR
jgi:hypothetical protein